MQSSTSLIPHTKNSYVMCTRNSPIIYTHTILLNEICGLHCSKSVSCKVLCPFRKYKKNKIKKTFVGHLGYNPLCRNHRYDEIQILTDRYR